MIETKTSYFFVYGLLMSHFKTEVANLIAKNFINLGRAFIQAELFDCGNYPAAKATTKDKKVFGQLLQVKDIANLKSLFHSLDEFEGDEYERRQAKVHLIAKDKSFSAWVYFYIAETNNLKPIEGGDYWEYLKFFK